MRKRMYLLVGALTVAATAAVPAIASATVSGQLVTPIITPSKLAKKGTPTPASFNITTKHDYSSPGTDPAATLVNLDLPSEVKINTKGLPICDASKLAQTTTSQATTACPGSVLGDVPGSATLAGVVGNQTGVITPFLGGPATVLLHVRVDALSITQILTAEIVDSPLGGVYGKRLVVTIPAQQVGGGHEILTSFSTTINKKFTVKKKVKGKKTKVKSGVFTANCKDRVLSFQSAFSFTQFAAVGIPAGPGATTTSNETVPCTPAKVKKK